MKWTSCIATETYIEDSLDKAAQHVSVHIPPDKVDLLLVYATPHYSEQMELVPIRLREHFPNAHILGCSATGVIGNGHEVENEQAISITAASLPGVRLTPAYVESHRLPGDDEGPSAWHDLIGVDPTTNPQFIILADPYSSQPQRTLTGLDYAYPDGVKLGGLASGAGNMRENVLFLDNTVYYQGTIIIAMSGNIEIDSIVAQGCKPIGDIMTVTTVEDNMILELDEEPPMYLLKDLQGTLSRRDDELFRKSLFIGIEKDVYTENPGYGDFLIRNIIGVDTESGGLAVSAYLEPGQLIQFYLRDQYTSAEDLNTILSQYVAQQEGPPAEGAVLFSCHGRGVELYGESDHDSNAFLEKTGIPVSGFFCKGEISPLGGTTYIHGYTSAFAIFRPAHP